MPTGRIHLYGPSFTQSQLPAGVSANLFGYLAPSQSFRDEPKYEDGTTVESGKFVLIDAIAESRTDPVTGAPLVNPDSFFDSTQANVTTTGDNSGLIYDQGIQNGYRKAGGAGVAVVWGFDTSGLWPAGTQLRIKLVGAANNAYAPAPNALTLWCNGVTGSWDAENNDGTLGFNEIVTVDSNGEIWFKLYGQTASDYIVYNGMVIEELPQPPAFNGPIPNINEPRVVSFSQDFSSYFSNATSYSITNAPAWASFNTSTGFLTGSSPVVGITSNVQITATNADGSTDSNTFDITISAQAPVLETNFIDQFGNVGVKIVDYDANDNFLYATSWSATGLPAGLTIDSGTGIVSGTPTTQQTYSPTITATNADGSTDSNSFDWIIGAELPVPTITDVNSGNGIQRTQAIVITGTNFFSAQDTGSVTYGGNELTVTSWSDTSITVTAPDEGHIFGTGYDLIVTNDGGYSRTQSVNFMPESGFDYVTFDVNYAQLPLNSFAHDESGLSALVAGDQIVYETAGSPEGAVSMDNLGVVTISNATLSGNYEFDYYVNDASDLTVSDNGTSTVTLTSSDADVSAPSWTSSPTVSNVTTTGFSLAATINETGSIYFVVVPSTENTPTSTQVKNGQNSAGGTPVDSGSAVSTTSISDSVSGLTDNTSYKVCFTAEDDESTPNLQPGVTVVNVTTLAIADVTPPTFATGPTVSSITQTSVNLSATINESGTISYIVVEPIAPVPTSAEVISGAIYDDDSFDQDGNLIAGSEPYIPIASGSGTALNNVTVNQLLAGSNYVAYFAASDLSNNVQVSPTARIFTTSQPNTVRSFSVELVDDKGNAIANDNIDYQVQDEWGTITDIGQAVTDGLGVLSVSDLMTSVGPASLIIKDPDYDNIAATYPINVVES